MNAQQQTLAVATMCSFPDEVVLDAHCLLNWCSTCNDICFSNLSEVVENNHQISKATLHVTEVSKVQHAPYGGN